MNDLKFAFRQLLKNPGFTAVAVLTLALGIGANTAIFSVVNGVLLRPLPYLEPERLIMIFESNPKGGWPKFSVAPPNFVDWREQNQLFDSLAAVNGANYSLTGQDKPKEFSVRASQPAYLRCWESVPLWGAGSRPKRTGMAGTRSRSSAKGSGSDALAAILASSVNQLPSTRKATLWLA